MRKISLLIAVMACVVAAQAQRIPQNLNKLLQAEYAVNTLYVLSLIHI